MRTEKWGVNFDSHRLNIAWNRIEPLLEKQDGGCWILNSYHTSTSNPYPIINVDNQRSQAHRIAYQFYKGDIPPGLMVRHMCHTPRCCNPAHLLTGTNADNIRDKVEAGRSHYPHPASVGRPFTEARKRAISDAAKRRREQGLKNKPPAHPVIYPDRKGAAHPNVKLSKGDALAIYHSTGSHDEMAARYHVCNRLVRDIRAKRHWTTKDL